MVKMTADCRGQRLRALFLVLLVALATGCSLCPRGQDDEIVFVTTGSTFSPLIITDGAAEVLWIFSDGSASHSEAPSVNLGFAASREQRLRVTPWSALKCIDLGYDGGDGGTLELALYARPDQSVAEVRNLHLAAAGLTTWCSSYNQITTLDFADFISLQTIECYLSKSLASVKLSNCPSLKRACFEDCNLANLDLTGCPALEDLRGAMNNYPTVVFAESMAGLWHICIRDNPQITVGDLFSSTLRFPGIRDLLIWNDNQSGMLRIPSTGTGAVNVSASNNAYTSADFSGSLLDEGSTGIIQLVDNSLSSITIDECDQITYLDLTDNMLGAAAVRYVLETLDALGRTGGEVRLGGTGNAAPPPEAAAAISSLTAKGWTVVVNP